MHLWLDQMLEARSSKGRTALDPSASVAGRELAEALAAHSTPVGSERGRVLFRQGEPCAGIYLVRSGRVLLTMTSTANQTCLRFASGADSVLGLPEMLAGEPFSLTAMAQPGSQVGFVDADSLQGLMAADATLSLKVLEVLALQAHQTRQAIFEC